MIKRIIILLLIACMLFSTSCSIGDSRTDMLNKNSEAKISEVMLEKIFLLIKDKDNEAMKALFSKRALDEIQDFDSGANYLCSFFQGDVKSWEKFALSTDISIESGKKSVEIRTWYIVETDKDIYMFFIIDFTEDTINPDNAGLYTLRVIKAEDEETQFSSWQDMEIAGIYKPEE